MPSTPAFELYRDAADEWRWRLVATNEKIIADSGEGYRSRRGAERGIESVKQAAPRAGIPSFFMRQWIAPLASVSPEFVAVHPLALGE